MESNPDAMRWTMPRTGLVDVFACSWRKDAVIAVQEQEEEEDKLVLGGGETRAKRRSSCRTRPTAPACVCGSHRHPFPLYHDKARKTLWDCAAYQKQLVDQQGQKWGLAEVKRAVLTPTAAYAKVRALLSCRYRQTVAVCLCTSLGDGIVWVSRI